MLWFIVLALFAAYYMGPAAFTTVAVLALVLVGISLAGAALGLKAVRDQELI